MEYCLSSEVSALNIMKEALVPLVIWSMSVRTAVRAWGMVVHVDRLTDIVYRVCILSSWLLPILEPPLLVC